VIESLIEHNIPYGVIPGIISLTFRIQGCGVAECDNDGREEADALRIMLRVADVCMEKYTSLFLASDGQ